MRVAIKRTLISTPVILLWSAMLLTAGCPDNGDVAPNGNGPNGPRTCLRTADCEDGEECVGGWCEPATTPTGCLRDSDCPPGHRCDVLTATCVEAEEEPNGPEPICVPDETRCADSTTQETCSEDGSEWLSETCEHECVMGACVICTPGYAECDGDISRVCSEDGSEWVEHDCAAQGVECLDGHCQVCSPGETRCVSEHVFEICNSTGSGWDDYACLEGECDEELGECVMDGCTPGRYTCHGSHRMVCDEDGEEWVFVEDCAEQVGGDCVGGRCTDLCSEAISNNSYIGCEYWPVVLSNTQLDSVFHDDFAVVIGNPHDSFSAEVSVYEHGSSSPVASAAIPPNGLEVIHLPWNAMNAVSGGSPVSQRGSIAYRLESSIPVTAYQFNPLRSRIGSTYSHTNDASILLPTHVYGEHSRYLAMALPHMHLRSTWLGITIIDAHQPTILAIVATQDDTTVRVRLRGATASGGGLSNLDPGADETVTLHRHEVLQLASRAFGTPTTRTGICRGDETCTYSEYRQSDLTGSIIEADKPIAVFSGADCRFVPFNEWACDHMEQQLFPFHNWGSSYIGTVAEPPPQGDPSVGDLFRLVAAVDGTEVSFTPAVHPSRTLAAGEWLQFSASTPFRVASQGIDQPIMLAQFFVGQNAHGSSMGDPTMILSVPTEQYRTDFAFITTDTIAKNYINVVRRGTGQVNLNDTLLTDCWSEIQGTQYRLCRKELPGGNHRITSMEPVGVVVYGYDSYVSYGYPAGLELHLMGVPEPGW